VEDGEMCISTSNCKIYFGSNLFSIGTQAIRLFPNILGMSIVKRKKRKKEK